MGKHVNYTFTLLFDLDLVRIIHNTYKFYLYSLMMLIHFFLFFLKQCALELHVWPNPKESIKAK